MKFALFYQLQNPRPWRPQSEYERYWQAIEQVELAEQVGFEAVWLAEHHFMPEISHSGAPEILLAAMAQRTSVIRLGFGVVLLPLSHPVRVAERVATLDIVSNGRVEFGTGRSTTRTQLDAFGVDPAETRERWEESVDLIPRLWLEDTVTHEGKHYQLHGLSVLPKPVQKPHPPMWVACGQASTYELAGKKGIGAIGFSSGAFEEMERRIGTYRSALADANPPGGVVNDRVGVWTMAHCAESDREARDLAGPEALWYFQMVRRQLDEEWKNPSEVPESYRTYATSTSTDGPRRFGSYDDPDATIDRGMFIIGDPDSCIRQIERYQRVGVEYMLCVMQVGRVPHEKIKKSIALFGKHVIPHFAARTSVAGGASG
ncbi:MAG: LLM class flavin-dependent oxidoreductase [Chloroflexi bacterium]|nr:LLM class flavin-dependent oxidoreductase [Chloroflexota bacterium]